MSIPATRQTSTHNLFFINLYIFTWNKQYAFQFIQPAFYQNALLWFIQALRQAFRNRDLSLQYILHGILKLGRLRRFQEHTVSFPALAFLTIRATAAKPYSPNRDR